MKKYNKSEVINLLNQGADALIDAVDEVERSTVDANKLLALLDSAEQRIAAIRTDISGEQA